MIHKDLHRDASCTDKQEAPEALNMFWGEYKKRIKPVLKALKEDMKNDLQEGILLMGLQDLIASNTKAINSNMSTLMTTLKKEKETSDPNNLTIEAGVTKVTKLTKPAMVLS